MPILLKEAAVFRPRCSKYEAAIANASVKWLEMLAGHSTKDPTWKIHLLSCGYKLYDRTARIIGLLNLKNFQPSNSSLFI